MSNTEIVDYCNQRGWVISWVHCVEDGVAFYRAKLTAGEYADERIATEQSVQDAKFDMGNHLWNEMLDKYLVEKLEGLEKDVSNS